jgi:hypothetical protein
MARKPPLTAPLLALMHGFETGAMSTRPARAAIERYQARPRGGGRFLRLPYQRTPDRPKSLLRRKRLALTDAVPAQIGCQLTESERAFCRLVRDEHERHGVFDLCHDEAAARMGCCPKTILRAQHRLRELALIKVEIREQPGRKHLPNVITIVSPEWLLWISRGPKRRRQGDRVTLVSSHGNPTDSNHERLEQAACQAPLPASPVPADRPQRQNEPRIERGEGFCEEGAPPRSGASGLSRVESAKAAPTAGWG